MTIGATRGRPLLADVVRSELTRLILGGEFAVGSKLPNEDRLCERFGVSRVTIREAVRGLIEDGLVIRPRPLHGGVWGAYADHRMATAGAIIGLRVDGVEVDDIGTTAKTMPDFPAMWRTMLDGAAVEAS